MCLTDEQRKLAEDNHNLIYFVLHKNNWSIDEYYDVAAIGLCRAAQTYAPDKGAFSAYSVKVITNQVLMELRRESAKKRDARLDDSIEADSGVDVEKQAMQREALRAISAMPEPDKTVALLAMKGYSQYKISQKIGIPRQTVDSIMEQVITILSERI